MLEKISIGLGETCSGETFSNGIWKGVCKDGSVSGIGILMGNLINFLTTLTIIVSVFFVMYGGFQYITSSGNEKGVEKAKQTITYALIGLLVSFIGKMLVNLILSNLVNSP